MLDVSPDLLRRQVTLVGSWTFSKQGQAECAEFVAAARGRGATLHAPLEARTGGGGLPALRYSDHGQGRYPAVLTLTGVYRAAALISATGEGWISVSLAPPACFHNPCSSRVRLC
jgi:hypothetical protein